MHDAILATKRPMGTYNALVDMMGHKDLGGKTMLYLIDALYASLHQSVLPEKWESSPFGGHWTASVFAVSVLDRSMITLQEVGSRLGIVGRQAAPSATGNRQIVDDFSAVQHNGNMPIEQGRQSYRSFHGD